MSIIADTLKRLQTQSEDLPSKPKDNPVPLPVFNKGEGAGRHRKESPFRFLMIAGAITIGLSGLAFSTFWSGWQLGFDLSTYTHSQMTDSRGLPTPPLSSNIQEIPDKPLETVVATVTAHVQPPSTPASLPNKDNTSPTSIAAIDHSPIQHESTQDTSSILQPSTSPTTDTEPRAVSETQDQDDHSLASEQSGNNDKDQITPSESMPKEPIVVLSSVDQPISQEEHLLTDVNNFHETEVQEATIPVVATLEKEIIHTDELVKPSRPLPDPVQMPENLAALKAGSESTNLAVKSSVPLQPSPANRLRHARQMIQTGEYKNAVATLSPLFQTPPVKWQPWFWMGTALLGKGDMEQADQYFLSGLARNDKVPQLWIQRALVAQQRGDFQLAIHELRQAESIDADIPHIHLNLGYAYEQLGNDRLANQYYGKFLKLSEGKPAFFSTRKKLFTRLIQRTPTVKLLPISSPKP